MNIVNTRFPVTEATKSQLQEQWRKGSRKGTGDWQKGYATGGRAAGILLEALSARVRKVTCF